MEQVRKPLQIISISFSKGFAYIKSVRVSIFSVILQICLLNFLWQIVYWNKETIDGISLAQMKSYLVLSQAISMQLGAMGIDDKIASDFYNGNIVFDLLKPIRYLPYLSCYKLFWTGQSRRSRSALQNPKP